MTVLFWIEAGCVLFLVFGGAITYYGDYYYQAAERMKSLRLIDQIEQWRLTQPRPCGNGCGRSILTGKNLCWKCRVDEDFYGSAAPKEVNLNLCDSCSCPIGLSSGIIATATGAPPPRPPPTPIPSSGRKVLS